MKVKKEGEKGGWKSWFKTHHSKNWDHGICSHHFMANRWGKFVNSGRFYFLVSKVTVDSDCSHEIKRHLLLERKGMTNLESILKSRDMTLPTKVCTLKGMVFPVVMYGCESWTIKKAEHWWIDAFKLCCWRTLKSSLDSKEITLVNPKENQTWIFIGRTDAEASILWPPDVKSQPTGKNPDAGKDWGRKDKGTTKDEMFGWHHWLNGHEFEKVLGDNEGQGSLECCTPWGHVELDMT